MIFTGPIDEFFDYRFGKLPYRSLEFKFETQERAGRAAGAGDQLSERERLHARHRVQVPDRSGAREDDARLRVSAGRGRSVLSRCRGRRTPRCTSSIRSSPTQTPGVHFVGRLGTYKYYNMDQVVAQALTLYCKIGGCRAPARDCGDRRVSGVPSACRSNCGAASSARSTASAIAGSIKWAWSGHDARDGDLDRFAALGMRTLRYPVLWERLAPHHPDEIDWRLSDARLRPSPRPRHSADRRAAASRQRPTLHVAARPTFPEKLARFAGAVARRYPWVTDFTPVNEPLTTARFSGLYGHWYPHGRNDRDFVRALLNQLRGIVLAMRAIRAVTPHARLIQTEDCGRTFGTAATSAQVMHETHRRWLTWDLLTGRLHDDHPLFGS